MESADFRELDDPAEFRRLDLSGLRRILAERQMRARSVVVAEIASQNSSQMALHGNASTSCCPVHAADGCSVTLK
jgi:hypothetical protein